MGGVVFLVRLRVVRYRIEKNCTIHLSSNEFFFSSLFKCKLINRDDKIELEANQRTTTNYIEYSRR